MADKPANIEKRKFRVSIEKGVDEKTANTTYANRNVLVVFRSGPDNKAVYVPGFLLSRTKTEALVEPLRLPDHDVLRKELSDELQGEWKGVRVGFWVADADIGACLSYYTAVRMDSVQTRLLDLKTHMPGHSELVYSFAMFLGGRLDAELSQLGFNKAVQGALTDLAKGSQLVNGKPESINNRLAGKSPEFYEAISASLPAIVDASCPPDFAKKVREVWASYR